MSKVKYPRTYHLPWSLGRSDDDKVLKNVEHFEGQHVIITEKMDGENTSLYTNGNLHARSLDSANHPSRDWVKRWWQERCYDLPEGWRVCGENLFAQHSIRYENLVIPFRGFSIWNEKNFCLSWGETQEWFSLLEIPSVHILWQGEFDEDQIRQIQYRLDTTTQEGYVVRMKKGFHYKDFAQSVAKFVRASHVQTDTHWMHSEIVPNGL